MPLAGEGREGREELTAPPSSSRRCARGSGSSCCCRSSCPSCGPASGPGGRRTTPGSRCAGTGGAEPGAGCGAAPQAPGPDTTPGLQHPAWSRLQASYHGHRTRSIPLARLARNGHTREGSSVPVPETQELSPASEPQRLRVKAPRPRRAGGALVWSSLHPHLASTRGISALVKPRVPEYRNFTGHYCLL